MKIFRIEFNDDGEGEGPIKREGLSVTFEFPYHCEFEKWTNNVYFNYNDFDDENYMAKESELEALNKGKCSRFKMIVDGLSCGVTDGLPWENSSLVFGFAARWCNVKSVVGDVIHTPMLVAKLENGDEVKISWTHPDMEFYVQLPHGGGNHEQHCVTVPQHNVVSVTENDGFCNKVGNCFGIKIASVHAYTQPRPNTDGLERRLD